MNMQHDETESLRSHKHLRSRRRRLFNENLLEHSDDVDPLSSLNDTLSMPDHSKYIDLYNSNDANIPLFPEVVDNTYTAPPIPQQQQQQQQQQQGQDIDNTYNIILPFAGLLFIVFLTRCSGGGPPGPEFHRGHLIRENAQRIWAAQARKARRREATPEERLAKIRSGVCTKKVLSKNPKTGRCKLGNVEEPCQQHEEETLSHIQTKKSTDTADTLPLEYDNESECSDKRHVESDSNSFNDDDEDVCPICLDGFDVGDTVMFERNLSCTHVFHDECLLPWLLERRENECPSCRAALVEEEPENEPESTNETEGNRENGDNVPNEREEVSLVDLENGDPRENITAAYFIEKGRVVAETKQTGTDYESESNTATTDKCSFHDSFSCGATAEIANTVFQKRARALSVAFAEDSNTESDLLLPLPLVRVSKSLPTTYFREHSNSYRARPLACCDNSQGCTYVASEEDFSSRNQQLYDEQSRFPGLHARFYDSPSSDDSSDEDDAIRRMVCNQTGPTNVSSIFHARRELLEK